MLPVRKYGAYRQLSEFERGRIVGLREAGMSFREIGNRIGRNATTVMRCWAERSVHHRHTRRRGTGALIRTSDREERLLRLSALRDRFSTTSAIGHQWRVAMGRQISMRSIYRRIRTYGLQSYRPRLVLPLTNRHRQLRLAWCEERAHWNQKWNRVIFSDESRFCLWAHDGRRRVRPILHGA